MDEKTRADLALLADLAIQRDRRQRANEEHLEAMKAMRRLTRRAYRRGIPKVRIAEAAGISRPTLDSLLSPERTDRR